MRLYNRIFPSLADSAITLLTRWFCFQTFAVTGRADTAIPSESAACTFGYAFMTCGGFVVKYDRFSGCIGFSFIPSGHLTSPMAKILAIKYTLTFISSAVFMFQIKPVHVSEYAQNKNYSYEELITVIINIIDVSTKTNKVSYNDS